MNESSSAQRTNHPIQHLIDTHRIVVCVGSGGVGKTTTSAVLGLHAALKGKKVLVLTIDPAKRLANSLGLKELSNEPSKVSLPDNASQASNLHGEMWAMMLDMKESFDRVVEKHAPEEEREKILNNRIYNYFSTSLAGTQDYAAAERLFEMYETGRWDLIILDTPPSTHAVDFIEAPKRLEDAIENKALQWLYRPSVLAGKKGLGVLSLGTSYVLKTLSKLTGAQLLDEFSVFLGSFSTLFEGLNARAKVVRETLASDVASFVVVTSPDAATLHEAATFHQRLAKEDVRIGAFIVNRVHPLWATEAELSDETKVESMLRDSPLPGLPPDEEAKFTKDLIENVREFNKIAESDVEAIKQFSRKIPGIPIQQVPLLPTDIHSIDGLLKVRGGLGLH